MYKKQEDDADWKKGTIESINGDGTYDINVEDSWFSKDVGIPGNVIYKQARGQCRSERRGVSRNTYYRAIQCVLKNVIKLQKLHTDKIVDGSILHFFM